MWYHFITTKTIPNKTCEILRNGLYNKNRYFEKDYLQILSYFFRGNDSTVSEVHRRYALWCYNAMAAKSCALSEIAQSLQEDTQKVNTFQDTVRVYCELEYLYDAMILIYRCTPPNLLNG